MINTFRHRAVITALCALVITGCSGTSDTGSSDGVAADPPAANAGEVEGAASATDCVSPGDGSELLDQNYRDHQVPWKRTGAEKVAIYFESGDVTPEYREYLDQGAAAWNRSPCLDVRIVERCPDDVNCVTVSLTRGDDADGNFAAVEEQDFMVGGHLDLYYEQLDRLGDGAKLNVTIHEMGHAVGLRHRETERVLMNADTYADIFEPDETSYYNLLVLYGNQLL